VDSQSLTLLEGYLMKSKRQSLLSIAGSFSVIAVVAAVFLLQSCSSTTHTLAYNPYATATTTSAVYTPPSWAPAYANITNVHYYYFPDCDAYYDAANQQFYSLNSGAWTPSASVPSNCSNLDLNTAYTVMLNNNVSQPWTNDAFYRTNYPVHSYDQYGNIIATYNLVPDLPPGYEASARAFDENTNQVIFLGRNPSAISGSYVYRAVPMSAISPYMPPETHIYYYGGGYRSR
jgi:hypothetical protein